MPAMDLVTKALRVGEGRKFKAYEKRAEAINRYEPEMEALSDVELREEADSLRERARGGESLEDLIPEAFALTREASRRSTGQRHYDVQLIGGMVLNDGKIAEMKTGEGKTLVATLPVYLNALAGRGVHVVTVTASLARRDAEWMGAIYRFLGLSVGVILHELNDEQRLKAYACDITYGTNNEYGFDYLRDNMKYATNEMVQYGGRPAELAGHNFAIVDEVDSILIDEARTPLIISGPLGNENDGMYFEHNNSVARLVNRQTQLVNQLVGEAQRDIEKGEQADGILKLYKAQLGSPKNRGLMKMLNEPGIKQDR